MPYVYATNCSLSHKEFFLAKGFEYRTHKSKKYARTNNTVSCSCINSSPLKKERLYFATCLKDVNDNKSDKVYESYD